MLRGLFGFQFPEGIPSVILTGVLVLLASASAFLLFFGPFAAAEFAKRNSYEVYSLVRWAFAESIGIYGFLTFLLTGSWAVFILSLALSFSLLMVFMPKPVALERYKGFRSAVR